MGLSTDPPYHAVAPPEDPPTVAAANRRAISEDWLATLVGLVLVALVLAGVITDGLIP